MIRRRSLPPYLAVVAVGIVLAVLPALFGGRPFYLRLLTQMLVFMGFTVAFNLIFGHTRQLFLCLGALAGTAAYVSVVLTMRLGLTPILTIPAGMAVSAVVGALFSYASVRRGLGLMFVGIVTLAFSLTFENLVLGLRDLTHGETGLVTTGLGLPIMEHRFGAYYVLLGTLVVALVVYEALVRSRVGLAFRALSDDDLTAALAGVDVARYKMLAAALGSALLGLTGALYAYYNGFISPSIFSLTAVDVVVLVMLLFGGLATLLGPVAGGAVFSAVNELVRPLGSLNVLVYGALMILLFLFRDSLLSALTRLGRR
ncbi:MAG: branched-chain amino acid ABC transporter permease, partial [Chloroflexota bacterium]|nr:branched-chain amino acid ABC transporter permease [Chloroflexota bacterium]